MTTRTARFVAAAMMVWLLASGAATGQDEPKAEEPEAEAIPLQEVNPQRIQQRGIALIGCHCVRSNGTKVLAQTEPDGPLRLATTDFLGHIFLFAPDGESFKRIKLEGASDIYAQIEDLHCVTLNGKPHWLAVINRLRDRLITIGLYTIDGAKVATHTHTPTTERDEHVTVNVEFADVTGDAKPEIIGTITRSTRDTDTEDGKHATQIFVLSDTCVVLASKAIDAELPGVLHVCPPAAAGNAPLILLEEGSNLRKFTFREIAAGDAAPASEPKPSP